jgi:hypothetical protein
MSLLPLWGRLGSLTTVAGGTNRTLSPSEKGRIIA